ncbi:hypothetical protein CA13_69220 [Planctomycetes bacterium CA13]|uniref:Uncharacterized protein n=1 Tax=Novipirellula herctigrandis TaxID=2527986 RepID=A0A5C5YNT7_9BACT|nr:hypothetical protein CA13_69220 [Planctomycetes bacterium CA13]
MTTIPIFHFWANRASALLFALIFCLLSPAHTHAQDPPTDLKSDVLEWLDQLDASTASRRQSAERALIKAGPEALEFLPESRVGMSPEASERLIRVRETLEAARAKTQSKAIAIRLDRVNTLGAALEAISRDSEIEFEYEGDISQPIESVQTPLSFWHAVDYVLDQADLDINFYGGDRETLLLTRREADRPSRVDSAAYTGVYRIEPTSITSRRVLNHPKLSALNISMEISWEPRLTPIGMSIPIGELRGKLDDGAMLKPQSSGETIDIATNSDIAFSEFFLPMQLPAGQPEKIETLSGMIKALLPGKRQKFELALSEPAASKKIDSMEVKIEAIRQNGPLHEIRVGVRLEDAGRSLESHRQWIFENKAFVRQADGSRAEHLGYEVYRQTSDGVGIGYLFDLGDDVGQSTFIYESPTAVVENEVSFVVQDIPLP